MATSKRLDWVPAMLDGKPDKATSRENLLIQRERLRVALENIMGWIEGSEGDEQIPPRYLTAARAALELDQ